jgi:hypothetical protein
MSIETHEQQHETNRDRFLEILSVLQVAGPVQIHVVYRSGNCFVLVVYYTAPLVNLEMLSRNLHGPLVNLEVLSRNLHGDM